MLTREMVRRARSISAASEASDQKAAEEDAEVRDGLQANGVIFNMRTARCMFDAGYGGERNVRFQRTDALLRRARYGLGVGFSRLA